MSEASAAMVNVANLLSGLRLLIAPMLIYFAWTGKPNVFLVLLACSLLSDFIDGFIARKLNQASELGGKLDSWGDFATYITVPICAFLLWPDLVRREAPFVIIVVASYGIPVGIGFLKYGRLTSYHTWGAKLSAILVGSTAFILLMGGPPAPFRFASIVLALAEFEELAITAILPTWQANVPSFWHARQLIRSKHHPALPPSREEKKGTSS
jgi:CDP-diacylglycerol--glycerol-3-phosphate 3-phosphatidyltransferase